MLDLISHSLDLSFDKEKHVNCVKKNHHSRNPNTPKLKDVQLFLRRQRNQEIKERFKIFNLPDLHMSVSV